MERKQKTVSPSSGGDKLINEAIKRILQDIVIRGHGDRLIGRWSREPELQQFLEQVPYMLDRINQLHLACTRVEESHSSIDGHHHHHHHHNHHHHHHHHHHHRSLSEKQNSPINDFISLIGQSRHWMVRVRDPLGLTPLHKAVLYNNRPIVEYILDRYSDELAPAPINPASNNQNHHQRARLVDAQDKYGRTALHYAAAALASNQRDQATSQHHIYQFLIAKGASLNLRDFRGKTPAYYVRHPNQLRAKSIIHLANKLNANYQASILTKTLRATSSRAPISSLSPGDQNSNGETEFNRESMSVSCVDLRNGMLATKEVERVAPGRCRSSDRVDLPFELGADTIDGHIVAQQTDDEPLNNETQDNTNESLKLESIESLCSDESINGTRPEFCTPEQALRWLVQERRQGNPVLSQHTKQHIRKCLNDGVVDRVFELVAEGYGVFILQEAGNFCWNQQCKRYINNVVPSLMRQVDSLHEYIATNQVNAFKALLSEEPTLARIRRPYKRASQGALHIAVQLDRRRIVKHLVGCFPELITQRDSNGATCLHWAAKSLKCERLYCWLTEHHGPQLEQLLDSKGKSAAEYRCQALRLSNFGESRPIRREQDSNVALLLKQTQQASDKLQFTGTKVPLRRREPALKKSPKFGDKSETGAGVDASTAQSPEIPLDQSIDISIEEESENDEPDELEDSNQAQQQSRKSSSSSSQVDQVRGNAARRQSFTTTKECLTVISDEQMNDQDESNQNFLGEMVQLDSSEVAAGENCSPANPGTKLHSAGPKEEDKPQECLQQNPASPRSIESSTASSSTRRLEPLIMSCIKNNNYTKLQHLILAGRGHQVLEVCANLYDSDSLDPTMRHFLDSKVPDLMENILKLHNLLHQCYAEESNKVEKKVHVSNFNKLCAIIEKTDELIMGRDTYGATLLHVAIMRSHNQLVEYLLRKCKNAAGAPDNQKRTAMHYAAIALAAYKHHGELKLANFQDLQAFNLPPEGFWTLGEHTEQIYEDLCSNFVDLSEIQDKLGFSDTDYLRQALAQSHVDLTRIESSELLDPQALVKCCPDFAQLLSRYNYFIMQDEGQLDASTAAKPIQAGSQRKLNGVRKKSSSSGTQTKTMRRTGSCGAGSTMASNGQTRKSGVNSSRSRTADELLRQLHSSDIMVPAPPVKSLESTMVTVQVAPKPTVGSSVGFHHHNVPSPTNIQDTPASPLRAASSCGGRHTPVSRTSQKSASGSLGGGGTKRKHHNQRPLLDDLDPNNPERHHHRHHHHHHHRVRHVYCNGPVNHHHHSSSSRSKQTSACPSVVGGVIVPSIIHNDNRDEIETYDIIYRQPPPSKTPEARESDQSSSISCSSSDDDRETNGNESGRRSRGSRRDISSASDSNDSDSDQGDEYDDRVQRLSNEFEERVRKEKNELKAKVDQIMNEIKLSAKSGRSSRFLSSPNDIEALTGEESTTQTDETKGFVQSQEMKGGNGDASGEQNRCQLGNSLSSSSRTSLSGSTATSACCSSSVSRTSQDSSTASTSSSAKGSSRSAKQEVQVKVTEAAPIANHVGVTNNQKQNVKKQTQDISALIGEIQKTQPASKNAYGQTYLHFIASRAQNATTLYKVIDHGSHLIGERDIFYRTFRDVALQFNLPTNVQVIDKFIIDQFIAGNTELLRHLLNQGYSPLIHVSDSDGNDIMLILKLLELDRMVHFLLQMADFQRWRDELHTFIRHGYSAGVSELIRKHKDLIRANSVHSRTSLHLAVLFDRLDMIDELLEVDPGCVHATDNMGRTALHYTYGLNGLQDAETIRDKLIAKGASINLRDAKMRTPKYYYIFKREIEEIKRIELELN